jgi:allophanate hydrolase subunit 2
MGVSAVDRATEESIAQEQLAVGGKENVLEALGSISTTLREKLGESLKTVKKLDTQWDVSSRVPGHALVHDAARGNKQPKTRLSIGTENQGRSSSNN